MNWIEEALDEIGNSAIGDRERWKQIILSHAPVIDAEKLAEKAEKLMASWDWYLGHAENSPPKEERQKLITQLITDSIDQQSL